MGTKLLNEFSLIFADNHEETFMAEDMRAAVNAKETPALSIVRAQRIRTQIGVQTPVRYVKFNVTITPAIAATDGCHATPQTWIVQEDTPVIFTAITTDGYQFDGWFEKDGTTAIATDAVTEIVVDYPADPNVLAHEYEARFSPIP